MSDAPQRVKGRPRTHACVVALLLGVSAPAYAAELPAAQIDAPAELPSPAELEREGAVIGEIMVFPQNIFDVKDPRENTGLYRLANRLHIRTQPNVIRRQLLFKSGDPYSERQLAESERILRSQRYLYDASVRPIAYQDGRVDVAVTTRDVWTLNPGVSFGRSGGKNTTGVEIEELNVLGTGAALSIERISGVDRDSALIEYKDPHFLGTWTTLSSAYASNSDGSMRALDVARPFYALDSRRAARIALLEDEHVQALYDLGNVVEAFQSHRKYASASWGWSRGLETGWARRWSLGATYDENRFGDAPDSSVEGLVPEDRKLVYPWVGFELIQDRYYKLRNHDQIGRIEDFFLGTRVSAQLGWADTALGSDRDALLLSGEASHGVGASDSATLSLTSAFAGRLEGGRWRNAVLDVAARSYVKQSERRLFFATLEASVGRALDLDTQILLGGDNGLRGYPLRYQSGEARALLTVEQRYFTNWYPFRLFRVGGAAFFDVGRTWGETPVSTPSQGLLKDVGVGLRIANTRSGLGNIIHIDLAFPLDGHSSISDVQLLIETKERF